MKFNGGGIFANFLDGFDFDNLAVDVEAEFFEGFSNLNAVYRAEDSACGACLGTDGELP